MCVRVRERKREEKQGHPGGKSRSDSVRTDALPRSQHLLIDDDAVHIHRYSFMALIFLASFTSVSRSSSPSHSPGGKKTKKKTPLRFVSPDAMVGCTVVSINVHTCSLSCE